MKHKRGQFSIVSEQAKLALEKWANNTIKPDVVAVMTAKQRVSGRDHKTKRLAIAEGHEHEYFKLARIFMDRLTKEVYKNTPKRYIFKIPYLVTLEGGSRGEHWHLNFSIRKPDHIEFEAFKLLMEETWVRLDWAKPDMWIDELKANFVGYSLKRGPEAFLNAVIADVDTEWVPRKRKRKHKGKRTGGQQASAVPLASLLPKQQIQTLNTKQSKEHHMSKTMNYRKAIKYPNGTVSILNDRISKRNTKHVPAQAINGKIYDEEAKIKLCKERGLPYVSNDTQVGLVRSDIALEAQSDSSEYDPEHICSHEELIQFYVKHEICRE